jgi:carbamoyl-phosphate synthase small subunit
MESSQVPVMGICLGHQLLALAAGARTIKLKYGNRAHNIPALDLTTGQCQITSQNHGYAVDTPTLPAEFKEYFVNLNDGSNEGMFPPLPSIFLPTNPSPGMIHKTRPIFSTQFHPEAKGGPMDSAYLFDMYIENVQRYKKNQAVYPAGAGTNKPNQLLVDLLSKERVGVHPAQPAENLAQAAIVSQAAVAAAAA